MKKLTFTIPILFLFLHLMYASDGPGIWTLTTASPGVVWQKCIAVNPVNQQIIYVGSNTSGVWKTTDGGLTWVQTNNGLTTITMQSLEVSRSNPNVLYGGTASGMFISTNAGANWTAINSGITESVVSIQAIDIDPTNPAVAYIAVFDGAFDSQQGIFKTTNSGTNWTVANSGIGTIKNFLSIAINPLNPNVVYIGSSFSVALQTGPQKVYKSNNAGATWVDMSSGLPQLTTDIKPVRCLSISTSDTAVVLAGLFNNTTATGGAYVTTNGGSLWTWINTGLPNNVGAFPRSCLIRPGSSTELLIGYDVVNTTLAGVYRSTNQGLSWTSFNNGTMTTSNAVRALTIRRTPTDSNTFYAGVSAGSTGVHEYTTTLVGIHTQNGNVPTSFALYQNFPNPFNPATYIQYDVPKESFVSLKVYDIGGKEVGSLVNETKQAGSYQLLFDASSLTSGVYFYTIKAGDFTETKKMMLIK